MVYNNTIDYAINAISGTGTAGLTLILMCAILMCAFLLVKYFRRFTRGGIITASGVCLYKLSNWIARQAVVEGNNAPLTALIEAIAFIAVSVVVGYIAGKSERIRALEAKILGG